MATLSRIPLNNTREICDRLQKKTVSPKTCHTSPRSQQGKARSGLREEVLKDRSCALPAGLFEVTMGHLQQF